MKTCERCQENKELKRFFVDKDGEPLEVCKRCAIIQKKIDRFKHYAEIVASFGVGAVIGNAIKASTPTDTRFYRKIGIIIGGQVLSRIFAEQAKVYTDKKIDDMAAKVQKADKLVEKVKPPTDEEP